MKSVTISTTKSGRKAPAPQQDQQEAPKPTTQKFHVLPLAPCEDPQARIAKRAYELYCERGCRDGSALDDWLDAEREILSQIPAV